MSTLHASVSSLLVYKNGRPDVDPCPMHVGLIAQLSDAYSSGGVNTVAVPEKDGVAAVVPQTIQGSALGKAKGVLFKDEAVGDSVDLGLLYVVYYENEAAPIIWDALVSVSKYLLSSVPIIGTLVNNVVAQIKVGKTITTTLGRAVLHVNPAVYAGKRTFDLAVPLVATTDIAGVYFSSAGPTTVPKPTKGTFILKGETAAIANLALTVVP